MNDPQRQWWRWGPESRAKLKSVMRQNGLGLVSGYGEHMAVRSHQGLPDFCSGGGTKLGDVYSLEGHPSAVSRYAVGSFMCLVSAYARSSAWTALSFPSPPGRPLLTSQDLAQRTFLSSTVEVVAGSAAASGHIFPEPRARLGSPPVDMCP